MITDTTENTVTEVYDKLKIEKNETEDKEVIVDNKDSDGVSDKKEKKRSKKKKKKRRVSDDEDDGAFTIENLTTTDAFAVENNNIGNTSDGYVHIRIQQRNGRKTLTTVQGISDAYDLKLIVKHCKKKFSCNGSVIEREEFGQVMQFQGDQRKNLSDYLSKHGLCPKNSIKAS
ncbi:Protein translation factor SUI1 [Intoshia linei]|uniref:Protein translation factor SUI1 n=1 Tax=Intoshia linei TaxID=1819745 RepID=A0A177B5L7_9BILA|nr:Protein translation factor SUI1 [Intoshia linei]